MIRLNKYLAQQGIASRRQADRLIEDRLVTVNDQIATLGQTINPEKDQVKVNNKLVNDVSPVLEYHLVYKPLGYVSTTTDPQHRPTVVSLVKSKTRLYPIGRLDQDSEGLVILTNDGELTFRLTHPKHHVPKTYHTLVSGDFTDKKLKNLTKGVTLKEGKTQPAEIKIIRRQGKKTLIEVTIYEGKNRQVRRMISTQKLEVEKLKRVSIGPITLGDLKPKDSRPLSPTEVKQLKDL